MSRIAGTIARVVSKDSILLKNPIGGTNSLLMKMVTCFSPSMWGVHPVEILVARGFSAESRFKKNALTFRRRKGTDNLQWRDHFEL
jgi:hypothetical protein